MRPPALVTGCSEGGIGVALALYLQEQAGYQVFATARKVSNMPDALATAGCRLLELDVTKKDSLEAARNEVEMATGGRLNLLINNVRSEGMNCLIHLIQGTGADEGTHCAATGWTRRNAHSSARRRSGRGERTVRRECVWPVGDMPGLCAFTREDGQIGDRRHSCDDSQHWLSGGHSRCV